MALVSVIVPCFNEEATVNLLLEAIYQQAYPRQELEVILADGLSTDRTRDEIARFARQHPDLAIKVVDNPKRIIPAALNAAIAAAAGEYLVRLDGHAAPQPDYIARCVAALEQGLGENVGGVWEIRPGGRGSLARGIAAAAAHPLGVGDAHYRYTTRAQVVDTVPFGAFRRSLLQRIGGFDESLLTNEDYELNVRIRQSGGKIWLDPAIRSAYYARSTLSALARQYWRYGYWKAQMLRRYPHTLRWRQAIPPVFVASLAGLALLGLIHPLGWGTLTALLSVYGIALLAVGLQIARRKQDASLVYAAPLAMAIMHLMWGAALLCSLPFPANSQKS